MPHLRGIDEMKSFSGWPKFAANKLVDHIRTGVCMHQGETNASLGRFSQL